MIGTIITPISLAALFIGVDYFVTRMVYGKQVKDTPENRRAIMQLFDEKENKYSEGIFHILNDEQREKVQYITTIRTICSCYDIQGVGWVGWFNPLRRFIKPLYEAAKRKYIEENTPFITTK